MEERKKRDWVRLLTLALCVLLLLVNFWQGKRLETLERRISEAQMHLSADIRDIEDTVYSQLQEEDKLVQSWSCTPSVNKEKRCLNLEVSAVLKEWREDTAAELLWIGDGGTVGEGSAPLAGDGRGTFTGALEIPLDRGRLEFGLNLVARDGGGQRRESLDTVYDTGELLPVQCDPQGGLTKAEYLKGVFTVYECGADLFTKHYSARALETESRVFRLRRNDEIAAEQAAEPGDRSNGYFCGKLSAEVQPGDRVALTFFCRDENGLGYEFLLQDWIAVEERDVARGGSAWEDWPRLTWD